MKGEPWAGSLEDTTGGTRPPPPPPAGGASRYVDRQDLPDMPDYRLVHSMVHSPAADGPPPAVASVRFDPSGLRVATGCVDGTAAIWDAETGTRLHLLKGHTSGVSGAPPCGAASSSWAPPPWPSCRPPLNACFPLPAPCPPARRRGVVARGPLPGHRQRRHDGAGVGLCQRCVRARAAPAHPLRHLLRLQQVWQHAGESVCGVEGWGDG